MVTSNAWWTTIWKMFDSLRVKMTPIWPQITSRWPPNRSPPNRSHSNVSIWSLMTPQITSRSPFYDPKRPPRWPPNGPQITQMTPISPHMTTIIQNNAMVPRWPANDLYVNQITPIYGPRWPAIDQYDPYITPDKAPMPVRWPQMIPRTPDDPYI